MSSNIDRRSFLQMGAVVAGGGLFSPLLQAAPWQPRELLISGVDRTDGRHGVAWDRGYPDLSNEFAPQAGWVETGFRGHAIARHPRHSNRALLFGRRPGWWFAEVDYAAGEMTHKIAPPQGVHFTGHGCFSRDGRLLYTSENHYTQSGQALIGVWDSSSYQRVGTLPIEEGVGLHDLRTHPNGKWLVAAVGGLLTHPDQGRKKLNLQTMSSFLLYLDRQTGAVVQRVAVAEPKSSIRHIDVAPDGLVSVAIQLQRGAAGHEETVPLMGIHRAGMEEIQLFTASEEAHDLMQDYVGSTVISPLSRVVGFTSPRGNHACFWNIDTGAWLQSHSMTDVCGLGLTDNERYFILTNSVGEVRYLNSRTLQEEQSLRRKYPSIRWDNHLIVS